MVVAELEPRIIPAYAGSTEARSDDMRWRRDHPRIRGEHAPIRRKISWAGGSSPHTRGAHRCYRHRHSRRGIIPAYAGSTQFRMRRRGRCRDHPRIRGEHPRAPVTIVHGAGSSPHTRGARRPGRRRTAPGRDHPRIRGEHLRGFLEVPGYGGSSPHTRGAPKSSSSPRARCRIIPAYAGSTTPSSTGSTTSPDHPRIRGEHWIIVTRQTPARGSSPHTRGALKQNYGMLR